MKIEDINPRILKGFFFSCMVIMPSSMLLFLPFIVSGDERAVMGMFVAGVAITSMFSVSMQIIGRSAPACKIDLGSLSKVMIGFPNFTSGLIVITWFYWYLLLEPNMTIWILWAVVAVHFIIRKILESIRQ